MLIKAQIRRGGKWTKRFYSFIIIIIIITIIIIIIIIIIVYISTQDKKYISY